MKYTAVYNWKYNSSTEFLSIYFRYDFYKIYKNMITRKLKNVR